MKAIMVMFDTLRRKALPAYDNDWIIAPNFKRLEEKTVVFENFYSGSLPCMPARRELHTGRYNFLHRSWGPLEPFDVSAIELLKNKGIYTHLVTDHSHYFEDGGATYHNRYNTWEGFRGQEGDRWKGHVGTTEIPPTLKSKSTSVQQNYVNRSYQQSEEDMSVYKTFQAGLDFLEVNKDEDNWFLQIECFDPHEPFVTPQKYKDMYKHDYDGKNFDWPEYKPVSENIEEKKEANYEYAALLTMCDVYLGKLLDYMDENKLWDDVMLIVNTDHGFLLGEHQWWGKNVQPMYSEVAHIPFFIWNPKTGIYGQRRTSLAQTIDIPPTLLDYFNIEVPKVMTGKSLTQTVANDTKVHDAGLYGSHGSHVNVTDGRYTYMRACANPKNEPLYEYTLMPTVMRGFFGADKLKEAELVNDFEFTNGIPVLKTKGKAYFTTYRNGNKLYDLKNDASQENNISGQDIETEINMIELMRKLMVESESPIEQYERIGIHKDKCMTKEELLEQETNRTASNKFKIDRQVTIDEKTEKQLNFLFDFIPQNAKDKLMAMIVEKIDSDKLTEITEETVLYFLNGFLDRPGLRDRKSMFIDLVKYIDVAN